MQYNLLFFSNMLLNRPREIYCCVAGKPLLACIIACLLPIGFRLLLLFWHPVPYPTVQDEFSYLFAGDTFASGRLTNATHPMWEHFETFQILEHPTNASKYPPGQGLTLALGQALTGVPWAGVLLSVGCLCGVLCWMLQGWLNPVFAFTGALLVGVRLGLFSYWMNSYWGGAVAAIGGALVLGAIPRIWNPSSHRFRDAAILCFGLGILANSRPFEGLILAASACGMLAWGLYKSAPSATAGSWIRQLILPAVVVLLPIGAAMLYYNYRVTGHASQFPYQVHESQYAVAGALLWHEPHPIPAYRHEIYRKFWVDWDLGEFNRARSNWVANYVANLLINAWFIAGSGLLAFAAICVPHPNRNFADKWTYPMLMIFLAGLASEKFILPHYAAPACGLFYLRFMNACQNLWTWRPGDWRAGALLSTLACAYLAIEAPFDGALYTRARDEFGARRRATEQRILNVPGKHLVFVRYLPDHRVHHEWVYNSANLDSARIVWARSLSVESDRRLMSYFPGRKVWKLQPDGPSADLSIDPAAAVERLE